MTTEQEKQFFGNRMVFATGVYLIPCLCADGKYRWTVSDFDDDTFDDGDLFNPAFISSESLEILENTTDEMEHPEMYGEE